MFRMRRCGIAVRIRVDRLELVVRDGHANQWVQLRRLVDEPFQVPQLLADDVLALGRRVDGAPAGTCQARSGQPPDPIVRLLDDAIQLVEHAL